MKCLSNTQTEIARAEESGGFSIVGKDHSKPESLTKFADQVSNAPFLSDVHLKNVQHQSTRRELAIERQSCGTERGTN